MDADDTRRVPKAMKVFFAGLTVAVSVGMVAGSVWLGRWCP